jgi:hypothetical protein
MKITKYRNGRESYDFKINKKDLVGLLSSVIENNSSYEWWLPTKDGQSIKLIVEDSK